MATIIGAIGGVIVVFAVPMLDRMKIDDVVGAIPVHLFCGIWGTLAVLITNPDATFMGQIISIIIVGVFVFVVSLVLWFVLKAFMGIRVSAEDEIAGLDSAELGMEAVWKIEVRHCFPSPCVWTACAVGRWRTSRPSSLWTTRATISSKSGPRKRRKQHVRVRRTSKLNRGIGLW